MSRFVVSSSLQRDLARLASLRTVVHGKARDVAREAERNGRQVARSYRCEVVEQGEGARVEASTRGINAAGFIEFGTGPPTPTPAYAPLRRGVEAVGLKLRGGKDGEG